MSSKTRRATAVLACSSANAGGASTSDAARTRNGFMFGAPLSAARSCTVFPQPCGERGAYCQGSARFGHHPHQRQRIAVRIAEAAQLELVGLAALHGLGRPQENHAL